MGYGDKMQRDGEVPIWLKRLDLVRNELGGMRFPRSVEEGVNQCAELSAVSMDLDFLVMVDGKGLGRLESYLNRAGKFIISVDSVSEGVCWFETIGSKPSYLQINVN
jgi:hypothetical protein